MPEMAIAVRWVTRIGGAPAPSRRPSARGIAGIDRVDAQSAPLPHLDPVGLLCGDFGQDYPAIWSGSRQAESEAPPARETSSGPVCARCGDSYGVRSGATTQNRPEGRLSGGCRGPFTA